MGEHAMDIRVERIYLMPDDTPLKAFVDICLNGAILIKGIKIVQGRNGLFVSMPQERSKDEKWYENIRCLDPDIRRQLRQIVLKAYHQQEVAA